MSDRGPAPGSTGQGPRVKICGLTRREDALYAAEAGADYLGVVLVPDSPRYLDPAAARRIVEGLAPSAVVVVADLAVGAAAGVAREVGASVIQLHGEESPEVVALLRDAGPWKVWKALRVRGLDDVEEGLDRYGSVVDGILLDGWHPNHRGGTGRAFSWDEVEGVGRDIPPGVSFIAAGGLGPENVGEAIRRLRPHVVDVSSGVERSPGIKDPRKVSEFIHEAWRAGQEATE